MTIPELLTSMAILGFVLTAIMGVFVSGLHAETDMNQRFQAQQETRLALTSMRTDVRVACSAAVSSKIVTADTLLLGFCSDSTHTWSSTPVSWTTWCIRNEGGSPAHYGLFRESVNDAANCATGMTGIRKADSLTPAVTTNPVFACVARSGFRPELTVSFPVDANLAQTGGVYTLSDTIMLRNGAVSGLCT